MARVESAAMGVTKADGPVTAALFDVDGTLVDTNYLHVLTWFEAFAQAGHVVPWRRCEVALDKAGVPAGQAVFVGDTVWDVEACRKAGVPASGYSAVDSAAAS